jgi:hypothetical protein
MRVGARYRFEWVDWIDEYGDGGSESMMMASEGVCLSSDIDDIQFDLGEGCILHFPRGYYPQLVDYDEITE